MNPNLNSPLQQQLAPCTECCQVMISGRTLPPLLFLQEALASIDDIRLHISLIPEHCTDPLFGLDRLPDLLLLYLEEEATALVQSIAGRPECLRPGMVAILPQSQPEMELFLEGLGIGQLMIEPVSRSELVSSVESLLQQVRRRADNPPALMTAFINARGGAGASMISAGVAAELAASCQRQTILMDMDLQSGSLNRFGEIHNRYGLRQALESIEQLDRQSLRDYLPQIGENLRLISARGRELLLSDEVTSERLQQLLSLMLYSCEHLVIDLPRHIDLLTSVVLERANRVVVVVEQTPEHVREGVSLIRLLQQELELSESRISVVVNRCQRGGGFLLHEIEQTLPHLMVCQVPNDYEAAREALAVGQRLREPQAKDGISRALAQLAHSICNGQRRY